MSTNSDASVRMAFGTVIRRLRRDAGLSQEAFGEVAGLHRTYVSMMERGIKTPTVVTLVDLAGALGMATAELMGLFDHELAAVKGHQRPSVADDDVAIAPDDGIARRSRR
jgi:transcriptional regulator with XRE-family HTH domain